MKSFPLLHHSAHRLGLEYHLKQSATLVHGNILDVGSKNRRYDHLFKGEITACDIVPDPAKNVVRGDIENLPFQTESFDSVVCFEVVEYTNDPIQAANELIRVCKKGGHILLSVPFMVSFHDDNLRLTENWFKSNVAPKVTSLRIQPIGNHYTVIVDIIRRQIIDKKSFLTRVFYYPFLWMLGGPVMKIHRNKVLDQHFASGFFLVIEK